VNEFLVIDAIKREVHGCTSDQLYPTVVRFGGTLGARLVGSILAAYLIGSDAGVPTLVKATKYRPRFF